MIKKKIKYNKIIHKAKFEKKLIKLGFIQSKDHPAFFDRKDISLLLLEKTCIISNRKEMQFQLNAKYSDPNMLKIVTILIEGK